MSSVPEIYCSDIDPGVRQVVGKLASLAMDTDTQDVMVKQDGMFLSLFSCCCCSIALIRVFQKHFIDQRLMCLSSRSHERSDWLLEFE